MAVIEIIGGDDIHVDESRYEGIKAALLDPAVSHLDLGDRVIKKTVVSQVVSEPETVITPPTKPDTTIDKLRTMI